MSDVTTTDEAKRVKQLRQFALGASSLGLVFWLYTFYAIARVPTKDNTGMQWLGEFPLTAIFLIFTLPALVMALRGRALKLSLILGLIGLAAFAFVWMQLAGELRLYR